MVACFAFLLSCINDATAVRELLCALLDRSKCSHHHHHHHPSSSSPSSSLSLEDRLGWLLITQRVALCAASFLAQRTILEEEEEQARDTRGLGRLGRLGEEASFPLSLGEEQEPAVVMRALVCMENRQGAGASSSAGAYELSARPLLVLLSYLTLATSRLQALGMSEDMPLGALQLHTLLVHKFSAHPPAAGAGIQTQAKGRETVPVSITLSRAALALGDPLLRQVLCELWSDAGAGAYARARAHDAPAAVAAAPLPPGLAHSCAHLPRPVAGLMMPVLPMTARRRMMPLLASVPPVSPTTRPTRPGACA